MILKKAENTIGGSMLLITVVPPLLVRTLKFMLKLETVRMMAEMMMAVEMMAVVAVVEARKPLSPLLLQHLSLRV